MATDRAWDIRFLLLAQHVGRWSKDPSTRVGAVIADGCRRIVSVGYNGFPRGVPDDPAALEDLAVKYRRVIHAEINAILFAQRPMDGCTLYVWPMSPCGPCASVIAQSGIARVVAPIPSEDAKARWGEDFAVALETLRLARVVLETMEI